MKLLAITLALLLTVAALIGPAGAQEAPPKPEFDNAPVTDVLLWAQKSIGCGFVYEGAVLNDPATAQMRRVTARHAQPASKAEKTLLLFELLKRCKLVPFEVGGMPGPTYHLYAADGAARNAVLYDNLTDLDGLYFASLSIKLKRAAVLTVATRIRTRLTEGIGSVEVFEETHSLIVTDYVDRLLIAHEIAFAAEQPVERDDDLVVNDFAVKNGVATRMATAIERLREATENWKATVNETANVLLISGRRDQVSTVIQRLTLLDRHEANPAFTESTQTIKLIYLTPAEAVVTLRQLFEAQIAASSVQVAGFERDRKIVFRGSQFDFERARATMTALDVKPEK